jgi:hypothetical protein
METTLAILLALFIYIGIPALIGFAIIGAVVLATRRGRSQAPEAEAMLEELKQAEPETKLAEEEREPIVAGQKRG